jgi:hypothetical protein
MVLLILSIFIVFMFNEIWRCEIWFN